MASLYIISGVSQPLLMTIVNNAGLGDSKYQIYILFYYFGLALKKIFWQSNYNTYVIFLKKYIAEAIYILFLLSIANLIHALSYFYKLK